MTGVAHPGVQALVDVMTVELAKVALLPVPGIRERLIEILKAYAQRAISYDDAAFIFAQMCGHAEIIHKMKLIIECDVNPLPASDDKRAGSGRKCQLWAPNEDIRLLAGIYRYGLQSWASIASFVGNSRTRTQCAQRWTRSLNPRIQKESWTPEEEAALLNYVSQYGQKSWSRISSLIGTRSDVQCRYHYNQLMKNSKAMTLSASPSCPPFLDHFAPSPPRGQWTSQSVPLLAVLQNPPEQPTGTISGRSNEGSAAEQHEGQQQRPLVLGSIDSILDRLKK
jgi:hypothetical protein